MNRSGGATYRVSEECEIRFGRAHGISHRRTSLLRTCTFALVLALPVLGAAPEPPTGDKSGDKASEKAPSPFAGLRLRNLGPAVTSGRVVGFAVHPADRGHYYVAVASGGVWKTTNAGTTWAPIFDREGSYSIGYVALDPKNPHVV